MKSKDTLEILINLFEKQKPTIEKILKRLLREKGIEKYEIFHYIEEASEVLPGEIFPVSGNILTREGKVYSFWLDWDEKKQDYSLGDVTLPDGTVDHYWSEEVDPFDHKATQKNPQYQLARKKLGLPFDFPIIETEKEDLTTVLHQHQKRYTSPPAMLSGLDKDLPGALAEVKKWESVILHWVKAYIDDMVTFDEIEIHNARQTMTALVYRINGFQNRTEDSAYDPYIDYVFSVSVLLSQLVIVDALEEKAKKYIVR
ncbi:MAG: hypothetical protein Q8R11_02215 [bacterium]|nr:hypothetical protein [bacterium]